MPGLERLIYVDDSYEEQNSGTAVFGWVGVEPARWRNGLRAWLELRKRLFRDFSIPPSDELHATQFINGRGRVVTDPSSLDDRYVGEDGKVLKKDLGRAVAIQCLETIRDCPDLRVGAVYLQTDKRRSEFAQAKYALYGRLVEHWDREHADAGTFVMVTMDGEDRHFLDAHRRLPLDSRHVIEDPTMHDSGRSQWVQMADLVAYVALSSVNRHRTNEFAWHWYRDYLATSDANGRPVQL